ncbi:hypothetical protein AHF37_10881 [Paragonimus kellicotti]|nr:hypothetical protein AHF37_10881 [Paragonimus kellicotti]
MRSYVLLQCVDLGTWYLKTNRYRLLICLPIFFMTTQVVWVSRKLCYVCRSCFLSSTTKLTLF